MNVELSSEIHESTQSESRRHVVRRSFPRAEDLEAAQPAFSTFLAELSARFINVPIEAVDAETLDGLRRLVEFLDVDRASLARITKDGEFSIISSYATPGVAPPLPDGDTGAQLAWYVNELLHGRAVRVSRESDLPPDATQEREYMHSSGLKSHLGVPITVGGMPLCALGVATFRRQREFPEASIAPLRLVGEAFAHALARREGELRLRKMEAELSHITRVSTFGQLATSIAHEINQPLCAIINNAQAALRMLERRNPPINEVRDALRDITADGRRAGEIVSRSHGMLKAREPAFQPVSLNTIVRDVHSLLRSDIVIRRLHVSLNLAEDLPAVAGDPVQLQQVVLNLFVNAADAMANVTDRERTVAIQTDHLHGDVRAAVADNGVGVTPDVAARMFDPFFTTKHTGLGMGLAISRTIVETHGGRIWAAPNPNRPGATVSFSLPARPSVAS